MRHDISIIMKATTLKLFNGTLHGLTYHASFEPKRSCLEFLSAKLKNYNKLGLSKPVLIRILPIQ